MYKSTVCLHFEYCIQSWSEFSIFLHIEERKEAAENGIEDDQISSQFPYEEIKQVWLEEKYVKKTVSYKIMGSVQK